MTKKRTFVLLIIFTSVIISYGQSYSGGSGTSLSPYQIANTADLKYLSENSNDWDKYFIQTGDIIFADADFQNGGDFYNSGSFFIPIGNSSVNFTGSYDGNEHKISNLKINRGSTDDVGFFGYVSSSAEIKNLGIENADITGRDRTGGLAGQNYGAISDCYVDADILASSSHVGVLVGNNRGTIEKSFTAGSLYGSNRLGGLVGVNEGGASITNSYSSVAVRNNHFNQDIFGGLVGQNLGAITNSYANGVMTVNTNNDGGLVGSNSGTVANSFWDTETTGLSVSAGGTGKSTAEMKTQATFTNAGWNFSDTWSMNGSDNDGYPFLQTVTPLPVELSSFTASVINNTIKLNWQTATEVNNYGFEIERTSPRPSLLQGEGGEAGRGWERIGFVKGNGNSNSPKSYEFVDDKLSAGKYLYRLKQIDNDGTFEYTKEIEIEVGATPMEFNLAQNYPNPFNPTTSIQYSVGRKQYAVSNRQFISLKVYDVLGNEIATLVNEEKSPGAYEVEWNASGLSSGVYYCTLNSGEFISTKKLLLLK